MHAPPLSIFQGPSLVEWMPDVLLEEHLPSRSVPRSRSYSNVVFEPSTALIVAASTLQAKFASFDEDGNRLWEPDGMWLFSFLLDLIGASRASGTSPASRS